MILGKVLGALCFTGLLAFTPWASAVYNANITGKVTSVVTYTEGDNIYFRLDNQPTTHPACLTDFFAVDAATTPDRRKQLLARLLLAYANGESITIGYDAQGDCSHTRIRVHRVG